MTSLLDVNVLVALVVADHVHHDAAEGWLVGDEHRFATCPITQGGLVRFLVRSGEAPGTATAVVRAIVDDRRHEFWPDDVSYEDVAFDGVIGRRQVTDAYLAQLARHRDGTLATFDEGLAALHDDVVELVPLG